LIAKKIAMVHVININIMSTFPICPVDVTHIPVSQNSPIFRNVGLHPF
jgi:hypothetical protein